MKEWYDNLSEQERQLVLFGGIGFGILVIIMIWFGFSSSVSDLRDKVRREQARVYTYAETVAKIKAAEHTGVTSGNKRGNQSRNTAINSSAGRYGLTIKRLEEKKDNKVQINIENGKFNDVLTWLQDLQLGYNMTVDNINIREQKELGRVDVSVRLLDLEDK